MTKEEIIDDIRCLQTRATSIAHKVSELHTTDNLKQIVIDKQKENDYKSLYRKGKLEISFMPIVKTRKYTFCGETTNVQDFENSYIKVLRVEPDMKIEEKLFEYNTKGKTEFMEYMLEYIIPTPMKEG